MNHKAYDRHGREVDVDLVPDGGRVVVQTKFQDSRMLSDAEIAALDDVDEVELDDAEEAALARATARSAYQHMKDQLGARVVPPGSVPKFGEIYDAEAQAQRCRDARAAYLERLSTSYLRNRKSALPATPTAKSTGKLPYRHAKYGLAPRDADAASDAAAVRDRAVQAYFDRSARLESAYRSHRRVAEPF
jgi:hypothetical protein